MGWLIAKVIPDVTAKTVVGAIHEHVLPTGAVYTDELPPYNTVSGERQYRLNSPRNEGLRHGRNSYQHRGRILEYLKRGLGGVYYSVRLKFSEKLSGRVHVRYSHWHETEPMFLTLLRQIARASRVHWRIAYF
jgi:hypothetical protein